VNLHEKLLTVAQPDLTTQDHSTDVVQLQLLKIRRQRKVKTLTSQC